MSSPRLPDLEDCRICPRRCGINRYEQTGFCRAAAQVKVAKAFLHRWEEPCLSGKRGSGTVFFSHCNLRCVYCQNYLISQEGYGQTISGERLTAIFLDLQQQGAHNINLVTPAHYLPPIREALRQAKANGLTVPVVYNTNAYETPEALQTLSGLIDVYLPDLKYYRDKYARSYSKAPRYFEIATQSVLEMFRQVGPPVFDQQGMLVKGLMIRHLVLPGLLFDSKQVIDWVLANLPKEVYLNLMSQYTPQYLVAEYPALHKKVPAKYYEALLDYALQQGLENGFCQGTESASSDYVPEFDLAGI